MSHPAIKAVLIVGVALLGAVTSERVATASPLSRVDAAMRVSASRGFLKEEVWAHPGVDLVGTLRLGDARRGFIDVQAGYTPLDDHTYLADGRMWRLGLAGGARLLPSGALRLGGLISLERASFHADPDVLAEHPGVDLLISRAALMPTVGLEASYDVTAILAIGFFGRAALTEMALFREGDSDPQSAGAETRARLLLVGVFAEFRLR